MREHRTVTHVMGVSLLHKCNFSCEHCGYIYIGDAEDHVIRPGYRMTWDQVMTAVSDCRSLKGSYWNMNYTGGEPTLWEEDGKDLVNILIATAKAGILPTYNTNGSYFDDYDRAYEFLHRYIDNADTPLKTFISMDKFHKNYDQKTHRAKSLDNLLKVMETFPENKKSLLPIHVVIIVTKDPDSSLPEEMKEHYGSKGITFGDFPMLNIGKAKKLQDQLPKFDGYPPIPAKEGDGPHVLVLVGEDYYIESTRSGKLGRMMDLYPNGH
jgi:MoaA/NifB/PqqE/SkfB family radical SAM enzyme